LNPGAVPHVVIASIEYVWVHGQCLCGSAGRVSGAALRSRARRGRGAGGRVWRGPMLASRRRRISGCPFRQYDGGGTAGPGTRSCGGVPTAGRRLHWHPAPITRARTPSGFGASGEWSLRRPASGDSISRRGRVAAGASAPRFSLSAPRLSCRRVVPVGLAVVGPLSLLGILPLFGEHQLDLIAVLNGPIFRKVAPFSSTSDSSRRNTENLNVSGSNRTNGSNGARPHTGFGSAQGPESVRAVL
jgi:hypothetical protein